MCGGELCGFARVVRDEETRGSPVDGLGERLVIAVGDVLRHRLEKAGTQRLDHASNVRAEVGEDERGRAVARQEHPALAGVVLGAQGRDQATDGSSRVEEFALAHPPRVAADVLDVVILQAVANEREVETAAAEAGEDGLAVHVRDETGGGERESIPVGVADAIAHRDERLEHLLGNIRVERGEAARGQVERVEEHADLKERERGGGGRVRGGRDVRALGDSRGGAWARGGVSRARDRPVGGEK